MLGIQENDLPGLQGEVKLDGHQSVELFFACRSLKNKDKLSLSDPQIIVKMLDANKKKYPVHKTEIVQDNLNPDFTKTFNTDFIFEIKQPLYFEIRDIDSKDGKFDPLGTAETTIGDIMGSRHQLAILDVMLEGKKAGKLIIRGEIVDGSPAWATFQFNGKGLNNVAGIFSKINPMFQLSRSTGEMTNVIVYKSEVNKKTKDPKWNKFEISLQTLCNNDEHRPIRVEVFHKKKMDKKAIGYSELSLHEIQSGTRSFPVNNFKKKDKKVGTLLLENYSVIHKPTFLEYLRGGIQLNVMVAIDFTQSNGHPKSLHSLHQIRPDGTLNDYQKAIAGVCEILLCYDYDKQVAMYGFGGKPGGVGEVNHCFSLTEDEDNPYADGLDGIMSVYKNALQTVKQSGPTFFKHILRKGMDFAAEEKRNGSQVYTIQLILTDGAIHDMQQTIDGLVECGQLPLSVIIVGVGDEDFSKMERLDADDDPLYNSRGIKAERDLVQFVPFNKFKGNREKLAQEVLAEVPAQFLQYMKSQDMMPKDKKEFDFTQLVRTSTNLSHMGSVNEEEVNKMIRQKTINESQDLRTNITNTHSVNQSLQSDMSQALAENIRNRKKNDVLQNGGNEERKLQDLGYFNGENEKNEDVTPQSNKNNESLKLKSLGSMEASPQRQQIKNTDNKLDLVEGDDFGGNSIDSDDGVLFSNNNMEQFQ